MDKIQIELTRREVDLIVESLKAKIMKDCDAIDLLTNKKAIEVIVEETIELQTILSNLKNF